MATDNDDGLAMEDLFPCVVTVCKGILTVTINQSGKACHIPQTSGTGKLTADELRLYNSLRPGNRSFVRSELMAIAAIRDKMVSTSPPILTDVVLPSTVPPVEKPPVVLAPLPIQTINANAAYSRATEMTATYVHHRADAGASLDATEQHINRLEDAARKAAGPFVILTYDLPDVRKKECPNPSRLLWRHGFRFNKSCWIMPESESLKHSVQELLTHWSQFPDVEAHVLPFADRANETVHMLATRRLEAEIRRQHAALIANIDKADKDLAEAVAAEDYKDKTWRERERIEAVRDNRVRAELKDAAADLAAVIAGAELFDDTMSNGDLIKALRMSIRARQSAFNAAMRAKRSKLSDAVV